MREKSNNTAVLIVAVLVLLLFILGAVGIGGVYMWRVIASKEAAARNALEQARYAEELARAQAELAKQMAEEAKAKEREMLEQSAPDVPDSLP